MMGRGEGPGGSLEFGFVILAKNERRKTIMVTHVKTMRNIELGKSIVIICEMNECNECVSS